MTEQDTEVTKRLLEELMRLDDATALTIATSVFVSYTLSYLRSQGQNVDCDIKIDGGANRDITIHAPKDKQ